MKTRSIALAVVVFLTGFGICFATSPKPRKMEPIAAPTSIRIVNCSNPAIDSFEYAPYLIVSGDTRHEQAEPPREGGSWRIDLDGGRVIMFAVRKPID